MRDDIGGLSIEVPEYLQACPKFMTKLRSVLSLLSITISHQGSSLMVVGPISSLERAKFVIHRKTADVVRNYSAEHQSQTLLLGTTFSNAKLIILVPAKYDKKDWGRFHLDCRTEYSVMKHNSAGQITQSRGSLPSAITSRTATPTTPSHLPVEPQILELCSTPSALIAGKLHGPDRELDFICAFTESLLTLQLSPISKINLEVCIRRIL